MKNFLFINNIYPLFDKADSGASNRSTILIMALASLGHVDVVSFVGGQVSNVDNCDVIYSQDAPMNTVRGRASKVRKLLTPWDIYSVFPINTTKEKIIDNIILQGNYDYVVVRYINEASECGLWKYSSRLIFDIDDNPQKAMVNAAKACKTFRNKIYTYIYAVELWYLINKMTKNVFCCFHSNFQEPPVKRSIYLHNVAICDAVIDDVSEATPLQLLVIGTFHYGPNRDGLKYFLSDIYPSVRKAIPNISLRIIGKIYDKDIEKEWSSEPNVQIAGYVPNLADEYKNTRMSIVPLYRGSGTSIKLVESMLMNRTCVSTACGVRGVDTILDADADYLFAENDEQFASHIINTINNVSKLNEISHNAKKKIDMFLSKEKFFDIVSNAIK